MKTNIRLANIADANQIATVHITSWQEIYRGHIPDDVLNNLSLIKREKEWQGYLQEGIIVWVIESDHKIIGFASICPTRDHDDNPKRVAELSAIYLLPKFWRMGLGPKLCENIFHNAVDKGFEEITTWVFEINSQARRFYESIGFFETGDIEIDHIGDKTLQVMRYRKIL